MIFCRARLVTMYETWLYHYDPETNNNQWSGGVAVHPAPKIPSAKILSKSSRLDFLGSRRHHPHLLSSKGPNHQRRVLLISAGAIEGHFEGKTPREGHQGVLVFAQQCPGSPDICNPREREREREREKCFHYSSDAEVIDAAGTWLDGQPSEFFFEWLAKDKATG